MVRIGSAAASDLIELSGGGAAFIRRLYLNRYMPDIERGTKFRLKVFEHRLVSNTGLDGHVSRESFHARADSPDVQVVDVGDPRNRVHSLYDCTNVYMRRCAFQQYIY